MHHLHSFLKYDVNKNPLTNKYVAMKGIERGDWKD